MSLETRISQMRQEQEKGSSPHQAVLTKLRGDRNAMFKLLQSNLTARDGGAVADPIDEELDEVYQLKPADVPTLALPGTLQFFDGFSYVVGHWYPLVAAIGSGLVKEEDEGLLNSELQRLFPRVPVKVSDIKDSLGEDSSAATWLNQRAEIEFNEGHLALIGAKTAIFGARKMYEQITSPSQS